MPSRPMKNLFLFFAIALCFGCSSKEKAPQEAKPEVAAPAAPGPQTCSYVTDTQQIKLEWTAYKFTNKTAVKGGFTSVTINGSNTAATVKDLFMGLSAEVDGKTPDSKDPVRNGNVRDSFFKKMANDGILKAKPVMVDGDDQKGKIDMEIEMNGVKQSIPFEYSVTDGVVTAKAFLDFIPFQLQDPLDSLRKACETNHLGPDGVSKTWPEADLSLTGPLKKDCK